MNKSDFILIACEESGTVAEQFIILGFDNVFSCDVLETSGNYPDHHIVGDVLPLLNGNCQFTTSDGIKHIVATEFSLIIAFPPCTYLTNAGARHLWKNHKLNEERYQKGLKGKEFFMMFYNASCDKIAIENPTPSKIYELPEKSQVIQPWQFGHPFTKRTQLWLKGLPILQPTEIVKPEKTWCPSGSYSYKHGENHKGMFTTDRAKNRAKTFPGIAKAMAMQWTGNAL